MIDLDHFSHSQYRKYRKCPRQYYFDYVKYPDKEVSVWHFELGRAYHDAVAMLYNGEPIAKASEFLVGLSDRDDLNQSQLHELEVVNAGLLYYFQNVYPDYAQRVRVIEKKEEMEIKGIDVPLEFVKDLETLDRVIVDHKTAGRKHPKAKFSTQLMIYSYATLQERSRLPQAAEYHICNKISGRGDPIKVVRVRPSLPDVLKTVTDIRAVYNNIRQEKFAPRFSKACKWCSHSEECNKLILKEES